MITINTDFSIVRSAFNLSLPAIIDVLLNPPTINDIDTTPYFLSQFSHNRRIKTWSFCNGGEEIFSDDSNGLARAQLHGTYLHHDLLSTLYPTPSSTPLDGNNASLNAIVFSYCLMTFLTIVLYATMTMNTSTHLIPPHPQLTLNGCLFLRYAPFHNTQTSPNSSYPLLSPTWLPSMLKSPNGSWSQNYQRTPPHHPILIMNL